MRQGKVLYKEHLAGIVTETNEGEYVFQYDDQYVKDHPNDFISWRAFNLFGVMRDRTISISILFSIDI